MISCLELEISMFSCLNHGKVHLFIDVRRPYMKKTNEVKHNVLQYFNIECNIGHEIDKIRGCSQIHSFFVNIHTNSAFNSFQLYDFYLVWLDFKQTD